MQPLLARRALGIASESPTRKQGTLPQGNSANIVNCVEINSILDKTLPIDQLSLIDSLPSAQVHARIPKIATGVPSFPESVRFRILLG
jgi:hypothetical protein